MNEYNEKAEQMKREGYISRESARSEGERLQREKQARIEKVDRENARLAEDIKKSTLRKLKEDYNKQSMWERAQRKINGKAPNWKELETYSPEAIEYLDRVSRGDTYAYKKSIQNNKQYAKETNGRIKEYTDEQKQAKRFNKLLQKLLLSDSELRREMETDKKQRIAAHARGERGF